VKLDSLEGLNDDDLRAVSARCEALLKQHDTERKENALCEARATLAAVGLTLKDLRGKNKNKAKAPTYHTGHQYQHPVNTSQVWNGKGKKPGWLTSLESEGKAAVEVVPAIDHVSPSSPGQKMRNVG
jgi:DNA-binding protein H-NS